MKRTTTLAGIVAIIAIGGRVPAQTPPPAPPTTQTPSHPAQEPAAPPVAYSVDVSFVEVDAVVTDAEGRIVRDLRREDFQIFEDGKPQVIDRVSFVEIPIEHTPRPLAASPVVDVQSNLRRFEGRLYVLLLDDLHTAASRTDRVKGAARRFVEESLQPGDLAAVVHVSDNGASQDFTGDRRLLLASIGRFGGRQLRSQTLNEVDEYNREYLLSGRTPQKTSDLSAPLRVSDRDEGPRAHDARSTFDTMAGIARRLAPIRGRRKALLWFGEGLSYDMFDSGRNQASIVRESSRAAVAAAAAANMAIYGIDARGLAGMGEEAVQLSSPAPDPTIKLGAAGLSEELRRSQDNLRRASADTGGFAVTNTDEFGNAFDRVVVENSSYYLLGYYPANAGREGAFHRLEVKVKRPDIRIRARNGYFVTAPRSLAAAEEPLPGAPAALRDALVSPIPQSALPMSIHVAPFKGGDDKASVLVTVEYGAAAFADGGVVTSDRDRLDTSVIAVNPVGKVAQSDHATIGLNVNPDTLKAMRVLGFRTHSRLELPPGRYQIRAAALLPGKGLSGSVHEDVEVPDFAHAPLTLSGLTLTSMVAGYTPTARFDPRMREVLPAPPSPGRDFRNDEAIALYVEVYSAGGVPQTDVHFKTRILNNGGETAFEREDVRTGEALKQSRNGYPLQVSLRPLPPGDYVLRLEASTPAAAGGPAVRETTFRVWSVADSTSPVRASTSPASLPFVVVGKGAVSGVAEPGTRIARTDAEWQAMWRSLSLRGAQPPVQFQNTMVVALFLGSRPTAGFEADITGVRREGDVLVIEWRERVPEPGNPPADTTPFALVGVPQHGGAVRFEKVGH